MHALLAELRVLGAPGKEILERLAQLDDRHLRCALRDFQHPRELLALDGVELTPQRRLAWLGQRVVGFPCLVLPFPLGQRPVIGKARHTTGFLEIGGLHVVRIERDLVGDQHWDTSTAFFIKGYTNV